MIVPNEQEVEMAQQSKERIGCVVFLVLFCATLTGLAFVAFVGAAIGMEMAGWALGGTFAALLASVFVAIVTAANTPLEKEKQYDHRRRRE